MIEEKPITPVQFCSGTCYAESSTKEVMGTFLGCIRWRPISNGVDVYCKLKNVAFRKNCFSCISFSPADHRCREGHPICDKCVTATLHHEGIFCTCIPEYFYDMAKAIEQERACE